jgi:delta-1-pyrroline-5-carboxylate synthetase
VHTYFRDEAISFNTAGKSRVGRGGMQAKIDAALTALSHDVKAVVIASGYRLDVVRDIIEGQKVGTIFVSNPIREEDDIPNSPDREYYEEMARNVRLASRALNSGLSCSERSQVIRAVGEALLAHKEEILNANKRDVEQAKLTNVAASLQSRLVLNEQKLATLVTGLRQVADAPDPIGRVVARTQISDGLVLNQEIVPIGVLLVIFESRPDVLPQVVSLALRSGNGLILKGGKEASRTNTLMHSVIVNAIEAATNGRVPKDIVSLVETRQAIDDLLKLDNEFIDLVIPRGSSELVRHIQNNTRIPVLGHAEGICHIFVDKTAKPELAIPIILDSKTDYPSACNAVETVLLHSDLPRTFVDKLLASLKAAKVHIFGGPKASQILALKRAESLHHEYSDLGITIEFVDSVGDAINHINTYSSSHTECIVTEDSATAQKFLNEVDSACVFHNCSTRFADGYRFGLGAEVGISTSRIHARGPVGIDGLTTTKWKLVSTSPTAQIVSDYAKGVKKYTHTPLPLAKM